MLRELMVLEQAGWTIQSNNPERACSDFSEHERYRLENIPEKLMELICKIDICANPQETAWFVTHADFGKVAEDEFAWNEFEAQSMGAVLDDDVLRRMVEDFWNSHFCFLMSVKNGYAHISIITRGDNIGHIVWGYEPEYEEVSFLAANFDDFMRMLIRHITGKEVSSILSQII